MLPKRLDETHPNRPETETAIMSGKDSNAQEITKSKGKKFNCFAEERGLNTSDRICTVGGSIQ